MAPRWSRSKRLSMTRHELSSGDPCCQTRGQQEQKSHQRPVEEADSPDSQTATITIDGSASPHREVAGPRKSNADKTGPVGDHRENSCGRSESGCTCIRTSRPHEGEETQQVAEDQEARGWLSDGDNAWTQGSVRSDASDVSGMSSGLRLAIMSPLHDTAPAPSARCVCWDSTSESVPTDLREPERGGSACHHRAGREAARAPTAASCGLGPQPSLTGSRLRSPRWFEST